MIIMIVMFCRLILLSLRTSTIGGLRKPVWRGSVCIVPWALGPGPYKLFGKNVNLGI